MPKVSIIVPIYNAESSLSSTLDSVIKQTHTDIEIICVDDGSTDSSPSILKQYQETDPRMKVIHQKNGGGSAARNAGLDYSTGEYIMFLDSDDIYTHTIVENAYNRAVLSGADIVFYNFARFIGKPTKMAVVNKTVPKENTEYFTKNTYANRFFNDFAIITWNKLVKRSVISDNKLQFNTTLSHNHDVDFSIRLMLAAESYSWLNEVGYYYRKNETGLTATKRSDPTNVLKILIDLDTIIATKYKELKPSFNNYVSDMIAGTLIKYSKDSEKVKEVFNFAQNTVIPSVGIDIHETGYANESAAIQKIVEGGDYNEIATYLNKPKRRIGLYIRKLYSVAQGVLARFTV